MKEKGSRISTSLLVLHCAYAFAAVNMNVLLCILYLLYVFCSFVCMNYKYNRSYLSWRTLQNMGKYIWRKIDAQTNRHSLRGQCQTDWSNMDESWMRSEKLIIGSEENEKCGKYLTTCDNFSLAESSTNKIGGSQTCLLSETISQPDQRLMMMIYHHKW